MSFLHKRVNAVPGRFGEALRELRVQRGYSQQEVSIVSGIHISVIQALEEERLQDLIDPVYAERHVRTLVALLDGQETYFVERYHACIAASGVRPEMKSVLPPRVRRRELFVTSRLVALSGVLILLFSIAGYVIWQIQLMSSVPVLAVTAPMDGVQVAQSRIEVRGMTDSGAIVDINGQQAVVDAVGVFHLSVDVPSGLSTLRIAARRRYGSAAIVERHVVFHRESSSTSPMPSVSPMIPSL